MVSDDALNVGARPRKGDKLHKRNIHRSDGAKYMSYFKVGFYFIIYISYTTQIGWIMPG